MGAVAQRPVSLEPSRPARSHGALRLGATGWAVITYSAMAGALLARTWFGGDLSHRLVGVGGDPWGFVWFLAWLPHALGAGHWPLFSTALMAPHGANLMDSPSIALPALVAWPLTAVWGPVISYDVLCFAGVTATAFAAFCALRRLTDRATSAWLGGVVYGFGGYMTGQLTAHVNLVFAVLPPVVVVLLDDVRRRRRSARRTGLWLGLAAAAQLFVNEEVLATTALLTAAGLIVAWAVVRPPREVIAEHRRALTAAVATGCVLGGPAIVYQLVGPEHVSGLLLRTGTYVTDLAGFVVPNHTQLLSTAGSWSFTRHLSGLDGEFSAYLGVPLICLLVWATWRRPRQRSWPAALLLITGAILSLGPHLHVDGHDTGVPLPWTVFRRLPLLSNVIPARFTLFMWLGAAALVAMLVDDLRAQPAGRRRIVGLACCTVALVPLIPALTPTSVLSVPPVVGSASAFARTLPGVRNVLIAPFAYGQIAMYAQAESGFRYAIPEGAVFVPGIGGAAYGAPPGPLLTTLYDLDRGFGGAPPTAVRADLRARRVDAVVVIRFGRPGLFERYVRYFTPVLGRPSHVAGAAVFRTR